MTARLLCPACGALTHPVGKPEARLMQTVNPSAPAPLYRCTNGHETDYPRVSFNPDAARRARIRPAMEVGGDDADAE